MKAEKADLVEKKALDTYVAGGLHCAEVISKTITEVFGSKPAINIPRVASGFGGGMGKTLEDTCGALTGGIIALGYLYGRDEAGGNVDKVMDLVKSFRKKFVEKNGSTLCSVILVELGKQENMMKCKKMTSEVAGMLAELINERLG